jgi:hypothetical protein
MKKSILFFIVVFTSCLFYSCDSAKSSIDRLEKLVVKVETKGASFTEQQWEDVFADFESLTYKMDGYDYDRLQLKQIGRLKTRFYAAATKYGLKNIGGIFSDLLYQVEGSAEEVVNAVTEAIETVTDEEFLEEEIEAVDEALSELESLFE